MSAKIKLSLEHEAYLCILEAKPQEKGVRVEPRKEEGASDPRKRGNAPLQVLLDSDPGGLHGVELGDLPGVGPRERGVGVDEAVQDRRQHPDDGEPLRALLGRGLHDHDERGAVLRAISLFFTFRDRRMTGDVLPAAAIQFSSFFPDR
jgi:hypothetical protein